MVDTLASGASARKGVEVQVLSWAPLIAKYSAYLSHQWHFIRLCDHKSDHKCAKKIFPSTYANAERTLCNTDADLSASKILKLSFRG